MIRINLLGEKVDRSAIYALELVGYLSCITLCIGLCFLLHDGVKSQLSNMRTDRDHLKKRLARLEQTTKEVDALEGKRKMLREKLQTIALLKARKHGPIRVLDSVNTAIPERAWLTSVKEQGGIMELNGIALDNQTIATFMANLQQHKEIFGDVGLVVSTEHLKDDVKLKEFTLAVQVLDPLTKKAQGVLDPATLGKDRKGRQTASNDVARRQKANA